MANHVLVSDSEGNIPDGRTANEPARHSGSFSEAFGAIMGHYAEMARTRLSKGKAPPRLLFYFNGGLNPQAEVEDQAERQIPCMLSDGYYPVFFVWDTSALPSYGEQITKVYDGQLSDEPWVLGRAPLLVGAHILNGVSQQPLDSAVEGRRFWRAMLRDPACALLVRDTPSYCAEAQNVVFTDEQVKHNNSRSRVAADMDVDGHQLELGSFLGYSALWPVRLISAPLAHGLGEATWRNYLRRTRTTVRRPVEFDLDRYDPGQHNKKLDPEGFRKLTRSFPRGTGVFARFFETLWNYSKPEGKRLCENSVEGLLCDSRYVTARKRDVEISNAMREASITMIGHSMGGIVINELIERFPDLPYHDIVVMASAASYRDTQRVVTGYFEDLYKKKSFDKTLLKDTRFYSLMLHPLNDLRERAAYGLIPSGSLLVWIDEMYEVPKTPADKTFGFWPTAKAGREMFGRDAQENTLYRVFSRPEAKSVGQAYNPVAHGDFNDDNMCFWRPAFWGLRDSGWEGRYEGMPSHSLEPCRVPG